MSAPNSMMMLVALVALLCAAPRTVLCQNMTLGTAFANGTNEMPVVMTGASAELFMTISDGVFNGTLGISNITDAFMAHLHMGNASTSGPIALWLWENGTAAQQPISGSFSVSFVRAMSLLTAAAGGYDSFMAAMFAGNVYLNVHTNANPGGEVRGQVKAQRLVLVGSAVATGANEMPAVMTGASAALTMKIDHGVFNGTLDVMNITDAFMAHLHMGNASASGPVALWLWQNGTAALQPISGSFSVNFVRDMSLLTAAAGGYDSFMAAMASGNVYLNVHTLAYPGGEVRGQVKLQYQQ